MEPQTPSQEHPNITAVKERFNVIHEADFELSIIEPDSIGLNVLKRFIEGENVNYLIDLIDWKLNKEREKWQTQ